MPKKIELIGKRFGRLVVIDEYDRPYSGAYRYLCKCDCGNEVVVWGCSLRAGHSRSCGCYKRETTIARNTKYKKGKLGVMEPIGNIYLGNIDLIIVPGISFDKELNRLGFGKGYYDKFLSENNIFKVGICFEKQIVSKLPVDSYDVKMDLVITDKSI